MHSDGFSADTGHRLSKTRREEIVRGDRNSIKDASRNRLGPGYRDFRIRRVIGHGYFEVYLDLLRSGQFQSFAEKTDDRVLQDGVALLESDVLDAGLAAIVDLRNDLDAVKVSLVHRGDSFDHVSRRAEF